MYVLFEMMQHILMGIRHQRRYYYFHYTVRCSVVVALAAAAVLDASAYIAILVLQLEILDISPQARENCSTVQNVISSMMRRRRRQNIDNSIYIMMMLMATTASWLSLCLSGKRKDEGQTRVVPKIRERSFKFEKFRLSLRYLFSTSSCCVEQSSFFFLWVYDTTDVITIDAA
jgi:hypothetical protein